MLRTGVSVVSPQWVLRSAKQDSLQRVVAMSLDATRRLPADGAAQHARRGAVDVAADAQPSAGQGVTSTGQPGDRAAREALLAELLRDKVRGRREPAHIS